MDCVQHGALCMPCEMSVSRVSRLHSSFNFNPSSLALSSTASNPKRRAPLGHAFFPVISAHSKPSKIDGDDKKFVVKGIGRTASTVVLACVLGLMSCNYTFTPTAFAGPKPPKGLAPYMETRASFPAKVIRKMKVINPFRKWNRDADLPLLREILMNMLDDKDYKLKPPSQHLKAVDMIIAGREGDKAENELKALYAKMLREGKTESAHHVKLALGSILIFQGKYKEAAECDFVKDDRVVLLVDLYRAIIHTMLGHNEEAEKCWEKFIQLLDDGDEDGRKN